MPTPSTRPRDGGETSISGIDPTDLFRLLASGRRVLVIDVRDPAEIQLSRTRFPGALEIPAHQLFGRRDELPLEADTIVTVSNEGVRSRAAALTVSLLGGRDVRSLEGGLEAWARKRLPLA